MNLSSAVPKRFCELWEQAGDDPILKLSVLRSLARFLHRTFSAQEGAHPHAREIEHRLSRPIDRDLLRSQDLVTLLESLSLSQAPLRPAGAELLARFPEGNLDRFDRVLERQMIEILLTEPLPYDVLDVSIEVPLTHVQKVHEQLESELFPVGVCLYCVPHPERKPSRTPSGLDSHWSGLWVVLAKKGLLTEKWLENKIGAVPFFSIKKRC